MDTSSAHQILETLERSGRQFHPVAEATGGRWQLNRESIASLSERVRPGDRTLETGCGYSTIAFALADADHTSVSPNPDEQQRIRQFCEEAGIKLDRVTLMLGVSQDVLPNLAPDPLDLVLIDGAHAFPIPFIDWYYSARRLRVGGTLILDDTHIRTGEILRDFMKSDVERWSTVRELPSLSIFEKRSEPLLPLMDWPDQPFCAKPRRVAGVDPTRWQEVRARVRLRTRLRSFARADR